MRPPAPRDLALLGVGLTLYLGIGMAAAKHALRSYDEDGRYPRAVSVLAALVCGALWPVGVLFVAVMAWREFRTMGWPYRFVPEGDEQQYGAVVEDPELGADGEERLQITESEPLQVTIVENAHGTSLCIEDVAEDGEMHACAYLSRPMALRLVGLLLRWVLFGRRFRPEVMPALLPCDGCGSTSVKRAEVLTEEGTLLRGVRCSDCANVMAIEEVPCEPE